MNNEETKGEAMFAGILIGPLIIMLIQRGALSRSDADLLIDTAALLLERHRASMGAADQAASDHARERLQGLVRLLSNVPDPASPEGGAA